MFKRLTHYALTLACMATVLASQTGPVYAEDSVANVLAKATQVATGINHTCALLIGGDVKCWGNNLTGQLGDGTMVDKSTPVNVSGLTVGVSAITLGEGHTCVLMVSGGMKCWGLNFNGQLGDGTKVDRLTPVDVSGLTSGVSAIVAGHLHTCAVTMGGGVKCWGASYHGELVGHLAIG